MTKDEAKKRIELLRKEIEKYRYAYHVLDQSLISDEALDSLKKELFDLEQQYPEFITPDSPTQRVGGKPLKFFKKVRHEVPMISLNDAFSQDDMRDWYERLSKLVPEKSRLDFYCEHKFDGLAISLIYKNGIFNLGSTRGDGKIGEDVTQNLKTIESIPLRLRETRVLPEIVEVRGEVLLTKKEFERINKEQAAKGLPLYANPRNVAAGSVRQLDPQITASRHLVFYAYDLITDLGAKTHEEKHLILRDLGFKTHTDNKRVKTLEEIFQIHDELAKIRERLPYEIDGLVVIVNDNKLFESLGTVGKAPRGAIAYKFPPKEVTTIVKDIVVQVGRTGVLTPVAILEPKEVGGVVVSRSTLHNKEEIKKLGLKIGDTVIISRAGDVIPQVIKVLPHLRTGKEKEFKMPQFCPICHAKTVVDKGGIIVRCPNKKCPARFAERLYHFVGKGAFEMKGIGPKIINRLLDEGLIQDAADLFDLKEGDIAILERYGEKSSQNIIKAINDNKKISFNRFLYSLSIPHLGEKNALLLARYLQTKIPQAQDATLRLEDLIKLGSSLTVNELAQIEDFGPVITEAIVQWFQDKTNIEFLKKLATKGVIILAVPSETSKQFQGLTFVFTGELKTLTREQAKEAVINRGGEVSENVSKKTSFVVVGENPGSKYEKAQKLGVQIISEAEFL
ncbi:MAG: NAD-dependent DNA ligase LigA, partial [Candidatus Atribacteria bacterium]|nr:NAD-dependent DNA ligase LigA [Candidatus Atribacteria bacterium]